MTTTEHDTPTRPRPAAIVRPAAMELAATEYQRLLDVLRSLRPEQWTARTDCPDWDVRQMAAHVLGMIEMAASVKEQARQSWSARRRGGDFLDALTALQVDERRELAPSQLVQRYELRWPKALAGRRRLPGFVRRRRLPIPQIVDGRPEPWTLGFLLDVVFTRDPWMHRVDITRATGTPMRLTADHDGVLVADVVAEWAARHGRPYALRLTGPAGGSWASGAGGPELELDAVEFCRTVSGRHPGDGLLAVKVPF